MTEPLHITAGELGAEEILTELDRGRRVVVRTEMLGSEYEVTLRHDGRIYYCDTPTTLHKHETREEMRECITKQGYIDIDIDAHTHVDADVDADADANDRTGAR
jgi:hypothetical protein